VIGVTGTLFGRLENWLAVTVSNNSVSLNALVALKVASVSVEIPGHLHDGREEAVPHRSFSHLMAG
jgi:hypothetical protein